MTELEQKAAEVWALMFSHAMPARVAVAFIQELTADRVKAADAILTQAVVAMANARPSAGQPSGGTSADFESGMIGGAVLAKRFDDAAVRRKQFAGRLVRMEIHGDTAFAGPWLDWCASMSRAIELCRAVAAEATAQQEQPR